MLSRNFIFCDGFLLLSAMIFFFVEFCHSQNQIIVTNQMTIATNQQTNEWHWDQAEADALKARIAKYHNWDDINAYGEMMREKNEHEPPTNDMGLPNFAAGPGLPLPLGMNYYQTEGHYPAYIICTYDVSEKHYDPANEPEWFKAAILQIRGAGQDRFPPVKWFVIIIVNRAEWHGASTFEQAHKVGAIFKASDIFYPDNNPIQLIKQAKMDRHPLLLTPNDEQNWPIVEQDATNSVTTAPNK
jgi:hypothetical protein